MNNPIRIGVLPDQLYMSYGQLIASALGNKNMDSIIIPLREADTETTLPELLRQQIENNTIDIGVMDLSELPIYQHSDPIVICAVTERTFPGECIIVRQDNFDINSDLRLKPGTTIGVNSVRQEVQLNMLQPLVQTVRIEKNVQAWTDSLYRQEIDAIIIRRNIYETTPQLFQDYVMIALNAKEVTGTPGQGVLACVAHRDDISTRRALKQIHHPLVSELTNIERTVAALAGADHMNALGVYVYHDTRHNVHATAVRCEPYLKKTLSQSTSAGMGMALFESLYQ